VAQTLQQREAKRVINEYNESIYIKVANALLTAGVTAMFSSNRFPNEFVKCVKQLSSTMNQEVVMASNVSIEDLRVISVLTGQPTFGCLKFYRCLTVQLLYRRSHIDIDHGHH